MKRLRGINLAIFILSSILILVMGFGYSQINADKIAKNTYIKDVNVGDLSKEEAKEKIKNECKMDIITFTYKDKVWDINPDDVGINYNIEKTIDNAFNVNRSKNIFLNIIDMLKSNIGIENHLNVALDINKDKLKEVLEKISEDVNIEMENARLDISNGNINVIEEKAGIQVDINATLANLEKSLQEGLYKENLVVTKVEPQITKDDLKNVNTLLGSYKTVLSDVSPGRVENIKLATERTSGVLLMPGEEFSYNKHTGLRTTKNGYKNATVIVGGEAVQGVGGGVCQVSTTLYNAVLYAGLDIVKVSNHSIPSSYVDKGRDATVSDNGLDFVFKNNYNQPVYIQNYYSNGVVTCQIYGNNGDKQNIKISTTTDKVSDAPTKKEKDPTLEEGKEKVIERGRSSYTVSTYRIYYDKNGKEVKKEKVATSYYSPKQEVVAVGTKKEEKVVLKDEDNTSSKPNNNHNNNKPNNNQNNNNQNNNNAVDNNNTEDNNNTVNDDSSNKEEISFETE